MPEQNTLQVQPKPIKGFFQMLQVMQEFVSDTFGWAGRAFQQYGDLHMWQMGDVKQYMVIHPDHLYQVLVAQAHKFHKNDDYTDPQRGLARFLGSSLLTSDGEFWKRQRKLMQPAFHHKRIEGYAQHMVEATAEMLNRWQDGAWLDVDHEMMALTLKVVVRSLFETEAGEDTQKISEAMDTIQAFTGTPRLLPTWIPTPLEMRTRRAVKLLDEVIYGLIEKRRADSQKHSDLLSMLIETQDENGEQMTSKQIRDELVTLYLAGHETTANTLNWTFYLLSQNPHIEARLHEELDRVLGGRAPTLADLKSLPYTEQVIKESMRLFPPAFVVSREAIEDVTIGSTILPKGAVVVLWTYFTHRDPRWWGEDAMDFKPERFTPESEKAQIRYSYLPFGAGPRICIGNMFALTEAQLMLASIAQQYRLRLKPGHEVKPDPKLTLRPKGGLPMILEKRTIQGIPMELDHALA